MHPRVEDDAGAIQLSRNPVRNSNPKHIDVRHHSTRDLEAGKGILIIHVDSELRHACLLSNGIVDGDFHMSL